MSWNLSCKDILGNCKYERPKEGWKQDCLKVLKSWNVISVKVDVSIENQLF